jgi:outer membrane murein-binding lipoprotein Lpp
MTMNPTQQPHDDPTSGRGFGRSRTFLTVGLGAVLAVSFLAGCGDDDDETPEEAFCSAGDSLETDVQALADTDIVAEGTDALEEQFNAIESDLTAMKDAGAEVASEPIDELDTAVDDLGTAIDDLGDEITTENATAALDAVSRIITSAQAVYTELDTTCS